MTSSNLPQNSAAQPQLMRHMYPGANRDDLTARLTTRVPDPLRAYMKIVAAWPQFGYRTQTQMYTKCMIDFFLTKPWKTAGWTWCQATAVRPGINLYHLGLEPVTLAAKDLQDVMDLAKTLGVKLLSSAPLEGGDTKDLALTIANDVGVTQASFALTFTWWVALRKHPIANMIHSLLPLNGAPQNPLLAPTNQANVAASIAQPFPPPTMPSSPHSPPPSRRPRP